MELLLPPGSITYDGWWGQATIDLAFGTSWTQERRVFCGVRKDLDHQSDHLPVETTIMIEVETCEPPERLQWQRTDHRILTREVEKNLPPLTAIWSKDELDKRVEDIINAITKAIEASTPKAKPSPRSIHGWTEECKAAQMMARRLRRRFQRTRLEADWEAYRQARNYKGRLIKKTLRDAHRSRVREAADTQDGLWRLARWARKGRTRQSFTPPLRRPDGEMEHDHQAKAEMMRAAFFPAPPEVDLADAQNNSYPDQLTFPVITAHEVERAIKRMAPRKAPGRDGIPAHILRQLLPQLTPHLVLLFNASIDLQYCPEHFRQSKTVVLPKPGKKDLTNVRSYRPIALLNTLGKALESILALRISHAVSRYKLLPEGHLGGQKGMSTEHALHRLTEEIHYAWDQGHVASLLLLDVSGAFDHVSHPRLLHNLRKRRVDEKTVGWIASFLRNRKTTIQLREHTTELLSIDTGIPQGSPISPILYLFYNADILEDATRGVSDTVTGGWVDDVYFLAHSQSTEQNCRKLLHMHQKAERWSKTHGSRFDLGKYQLVHLTRELGEYNTKQPLILSSTTIQPSFSARYLGIVLDQPLRWGPHVKYVEGKARTTLQALRAIAGSTWGSSLIALRRIYQSIVIPQLAYGCSVWYTPQGEPGHTAKMRLTLGKIQLEAARIISGAFRATSAAALDTELFMLPIHHRLEERAQETAINILTSPPTLTATSIFIHTTAASIRNRNGQFKRRRIHRSPLKRLKDSLGKKLGEELISNFEVRDPYIVEPWWTPPEVNIQYSREAAEKQHREILAAHEHLAIYTDGSGINGKVGAAAVAPTLNMHTSAYLGRETTSTVYAAELVGILMGLEIAMRANMRKIAVFTDNQAALMALRKPGRQSGQHIIKLIILTLGRANRQNIDVEFHWIPAHQGIEGNELADRLAKEATGWKQVRGRRGRLIEVDSDNTAPKPNYLKNLGSAAKTRLHQLTQERWAQEWETGTTGRTTRLLTPSPRRDILQLHMTLPKPLSSIIVQMRTEKIGLKWFLSQWKVPDVTSADCECGRGNQTVRHVLLACPMFKDLRREVWDEGTTRPARMDLREILNTPKLAKKAASFMIQTRLLKQFGAVLQNETS